MDEGIIGQYKTFMRTAAGKDLLGRFIANETMYQAEGIKAETVEGKALAMAKIEAIYKLRSGILDIVTPSNSSANPSLHSTDSNKHLTRKK